MKSIRAGRGLGDAIYLQSIVRYFARRGEALEVCTDWPDLFRPFCEAVKVSPHRRNPIDIVAHYTARKTIGATDQFRDCCIAAGIGEEIELRLEWPAAKDRPAADKVSPTILVAMYREPFARSDGYGLDLLPKAGRLQEAIDLLRGHAALIEVGAGKKLESFRGIDADLTNRTSVPDLLDLACRADGFLGYCSYFAPLAEALGKPALFVWSRRGLRSREAYIRTITPEKILRLPTSLVRYDDCTGPEMAEGVNALREQIRDRRAFRG